MLMERFRAPAGRLLSIDHRLETVSLVYRRNLDSCPVEEGRREIQVQCDRIAHLSLLTLGNPRIADNQGNPDRLFVVRPLPGKTAIAHVKPVIRGIDNNGIIGQSHFLKRIYESPDRSIDPADHAVVGTNICLILFVCVPTPEVALTIDGSLEKVRLGFKDFRRVEARRRNHYVLIHSVYRTRPGKMPNPRSPIAVLGVTGIEPEIQGKGLPLRLVLNELDATVDNQFSFVTERTVRHLFVERIAADGFELIEVVLLHKALRHLGVPFAVVSGPIAVGTQDIRIEISDRLGRRLLGIVGSAEAAPCQPGKDSRPADPANRMTDKRFSKPCPPGSEGIDIWSLYYLIAIAAKSARGLIVSKKENDVGRSLGPEA